MTAPMSVYKIVLVIGVVADLMMNVAFVMVMEALVISLLLIIPM